MWRQPLAQVVVLEGSQAPRQQQMVNMLLGERAEQGAAGQEQEEGESAGSKQWESSFLKREKLPLFPSSKVTPKFFVSLSSAVAYR